MARVSDLEVVGEDNVELNLGLSIGGISGICSLTRPFSISTSSPVEIGSIEKKGPRSVGSAAALISEAKGSSGGNFLDAKSRRELHALRRHEARKKTEEKHKRKGNGNGNGSGVAVNNHIAVDDRTVLEAQELQSRVRDRAVKEAEAYGSQRNCTKSGENCGSDNDNQNPNPNSSVCPSTAFPIVPMQYPFHSVQFMPFTNGYQYPNYVMPCRATASAPSVSAALGGDGLNHEKNVIQPIACRSFQPFQRPQGNPNRCIKWPPGCDSEQNDGSTSGSCSSAVSDNQSASLLQGGSSSDARSQSSRYPLEQTQTHVSPIHKTQILTKIESAHGAGDTTDKPPSNTTQSNPIKPKETIPVNEPISTAKSLPPKSPLHPTTYMGLGFDGEEDKTPKPSLPQMPCVSTTGNGPNGKTITGFLYRYTKTEVSIICVCHRSSFSPEEFVKHAGGTDVSHPLRHILVIPSALG